MEKSAKTFIVSSSLRLHLIESAKRNINNEVKGGIIGGFNSITDPSITYCTSLCKDENGLPPSNVPVGIFDFSEKTAVDEEVLSLIKKFIGKKTGKIIIFEPTKSTSSFITTLFLDMKTKTSIKCGINFVDDQEIENNLLDIHLNGFVNLPIKLPLSFDQKILRNGIDTYFKTLRVQINDLTFNLKDTNHVIDRCSSDLVTNLYGLMDDDELKQIEELSAPKPLKSKMKEDIIKKRIKSRHIISIEFNKSNKDDVSSDDIFSIKYGKENLTLCATLCFEMMLQIQNSSKMNEFFKIATSNLLKQLNEMKRCMLEFIDPVTLEVSVPHPYIFKLSQIFCGYINVIYPRGKKDNDLTNYRKRMISRWLLPLNRPIIRKSNCFQFEKSPILTNTHIGIKNLPIKGGKISLVKGNYSYHHYMQDHIDDSGWGCAYRSLQTIVSWFIHQGYLDGGVPNHKAIQQALVDVGDKQSNFIGSKQWIGSQEVSFVLNELYGIVSKIISVNSGSELSTKGRELVNHFETQGTPIMIGGGVLAHTIIGVHYDENDGSIGYLVLDPHYTGGEDISIIQKKGWCGWKRSNFWDTKSFYNLCLPQKPEVF